MKKIVLLFAIILLASCGESQFNSINYDSSFNEDLRELLKSTPIEYNDSIFFNAKGFKTPSAEHKDYYIFTLELSYKDLSFENIKIIMVPYSYTIDDISKIGTVSNIGYNNINFKLSATTNESEYIFKGYRLSYLIKDDLDGFKVSFKSNNYNVIFSITGENIL